MFKSFWIGIGSSTEDLAEDIKNYSHFYGVIRFGNIKLRVITMRVTSVERHLVNQFNPVFD